MVPWVDPSVVATLDATIRQFGHWYGEHYNNLASCSFYPEHVPEAPPQMQAWLKDELPDAIKKIELGLIKGLGSGGLGF